MRVLGIDIGGTKLAAGVVNADGKMLARGEVPTLANDEALRKRLKEELAAFEDNY